MDRGGRRHHVHRGCRHARHRPAAAHGSARGCHQGERAHRDVLGAVARANARPRRRRGVVFGGGFGGAFLSRIFRGFG